MTENSGRNDNLWTIGCVVLVIVLFIVIIVPSFSGRPSCASQSGCINNLRQIDSGKEQAVLANKWDPGTTCDNTSNKLIINTYIKGNTTPVCPLNGKYTYNPIGTNPVCSITSPTSHRIPVCD